MLAVYQVVLSSQEGWDLWSRNGLACENLPGQ